MGDHWHRIFTGIASSLASHLHWHRIFTGIASSLENRESSAHARICSQFSFDFNSCLVPIEISPIGHIPFDRSNRSKPTQRRKCEKDAT
jgi:hypothetical protein